MNDRLTWLDKSCVGQIEGDLLMLWKDFIIFLYFTGFIIIYVGQMKGVILLVLWHFIQCDGHLYYNYLY